MGEVSVFGKTMTRPNAGLLSHKFHHVCCRRILESNSYTSRVALTYGEIIPQHIHYPRILYTFPAGALMPVILYNHPSQMPANL
jgi:hypothetical protein